MKEFKQKLLLVSNSTLYGQKWLEHVKGIFSEFLKGKKHAIFIPYALHDHKLFTKKANSYFNKIGLFLKSIDDVESIESEINQTEAIIVGGGNTFRLLKGLQKEDCLVLNTIKKTVESGVPFVGWSAGTNIACPTIMTTNDMPIVQQPSLDGLNLIPFQINPHYLDPNPNSRHMGETREARIKEFHEENDVPVIGLREGAWLRIDNKELTLGGINGAKIFKKDQTPIEYLPGTRFNLSLEKI